MAFNQRFTGEGLVVKVVPTGGSEITITGDYTAFGYSLKDDNVDVTAGNERNKEKLATKQDMTFTLTAFGGDDDTWNAFLSSVTGVMTVMRHGETVGLEYFSFNYLREGFDPSTGTDKAEEISISGSRSGEMIADFGSVQGAVRHLVFTSQPSNTATTTKIADVKVSIEDPSNAVVTFEESDVITISVTGATTALTGTVTARVIHGVASFPGLIVTGTHSGSTLTATSSKGYTSATSTSFNVT